MRGIVDDCTTSRSWLASWCMNRPFHLVALVSFTSVFSASCSSPAELPTVTVKNIDRIEYVDYELQLETESGSTRCVFYRAGGSCNGSGTLVDRGSSQHLIELDLEAEPEEVEVDVFATGTRIGFGRAQFKSNRATVKLNIYDPEE